MSAETIILRIGFGWESRDTDMQECSGCEEVIYSKLHELYIEKETQTKGTLTFDSTPERCASGFVLCDSCYNLVDNGK